MAAIYPRANFLDVLDGNPDLYGPFWIATTVVFILFLTGTISWKLAIGGKDSFGYDFGLLSGAAGLIYGYTGELLSFSRYGRKDNSTWTLKSRVGVALWPSH
jgi:hypothetical protein